MTAGRLTLLPVADVELDKTNPRIRRFLEFHVGEPTYDQIALALDVAGATNEDAQGSTTPEKLKRSILSNGGIMQPIVVNREPNGRHICIEGNTRLYIYRSFIAVRIPAKPPTDSGINPPGDSGDKSPTDSGVMPPGGHRACWL